MNITIDSYTDWVSNLLSKKIPHFYYIVNEEYKVFALDGNVSYLHELEVDDVDDYELVHLPNANKKLGSYTQREPFASKELHDGTKLYRRKHGVKHTISANSESDIIFVVPYTKAKINKLEIVHANELDRIDLVVKSPTDPAVAAAFGLPADYQLNQFGFDVIVSSGLYSDKSDYDADVYSGFQIIVRYKNDTDTEKEVGFNLIYHEVV